MMPLRTGIQSACLFAFVLLFSHCGAPQAPVCRSVPSASKVPSQELLDEARRSWRELKKSPNSPGFIAARDRYNAALAKLLDQLRCGPQDWPSRAGSLGTQISTHGDEDVDPARLDAVFPATQVDINGSLAHRWTEGVGVPFVGWKRTTPVGIKREPHVLPTGLPYNLTAILSFDEPGAPTWHFKKRWLVNEINLAGGKRTLAADWTAPNAFYWSMCDLDDLNIQNAILPDRFSEETGLFFIQRYDPKKIPLIMVHGLISSPAAYKHIINDLAPQPWFRENYQIWLFNYPTGNPWLYSSMKFREHVRAACAEARAAHGPGRLDQMVILSHSMGGLITRSSVTNPGNLFYDAVFRVPLRNLRVSEATREFIRGATLYQPLTEPKRVIFMAVPHRGSPVATFRAAVLISRLIRLPKVLTVDLLDATVQSVQGVLRSEQAKPKMPNSVSSLAPSDKSNIALSSMPLPKRIKFHSIIGDRGKGPLSESSDGVVPYWSSHVSPVESEKIIPSDHSVPDHPQAAEEVTRILKLHLTENPR